MKIIFIIGILFILTTATKKYPKLELVDFETVVEDPDETVAYYNCVVGLASCTAPHIELKESVREIVKNKCGYCSPKLKSGLELLVDTLGARNVDYVKNLQRLFDPKGEYINI